MNSPLYIPSQQRSVRANYCEGNEMYYWPDIIEISRPYLSNAIVPLGDNC
jgi:hypothetical protein